MIVERNNNMYWMNMDCKMNGCKFPYHPVEKPEIEMIEISNIVSQLKNKTDKSSVYVLICENSKFYVGYTMKNINEQLKEHRNNGSNWTCINKVIGILYHFPGDKNDENNMTLLMSKCVGEENVRGGKWDDYRNVIFEKKDKDMIISELLTKVPRKK